MRLDSAVQQWAMCLQSGVLSDRVLRRQQLRAVRQPDRRAVRHGWPRVRRLRNGQDVQQIEQRLRQLVRKANATERRRNS